MTLRIDETVLTAYALGECSPEDVHEVELLLRRSAAARALVEELRELAAIAEEALLDEPALRDDQRQAIMDAAAARDRVETPVMAPVATPVLSPPPAGLERDDEVVPLRSRRRIWALRISAMGAVAAVALASVMVPLFSVGNAPVSRAPVGQSTASYGPVTQTDRDGRLETPTSLDDESTERLLSRLEGLQTRPTDRMSFDADGDRQGPTALSPAMKRRLIEEGRLAPDAGTEAGRTQQQQAKTDERRRRAALMARRSMEYRGDKGGEEAWTDEDKSRWSHAEDSIRKPTTSALGGETYNPISHNDFALVTDEPLSTFSTDVDTASYANVRRFLEHHTLPPASAVRIEELINYFDYGYAPPRGDAPFATHVEIASCPWNSGHRLARIGIKGKVVAEDALPPSNLVFLLDVSGSMSAQNKLPLVQQAIRLLVHELDERDRVAIVVYAGSSGLVLPSTSGDAPQTILRALDRLQAGGSTAGAAGIELAYQTAVANFIPGGSNRVILATDGDFNVGTSDQHALLELIEDRAKSGVFLTVLGFGMGNLADGTLEQLADHGNGNYAYIDDLDEARKVLVTERGGTTMTIAKDVKIQVEFNPLEVHAYRLIGYENRALAARDFDDDSKDAGEIGAGHTVTALYEIVPAGADLAVPGAPVLKYQQPTGTTAAAGSGELMTVKLRYKRPDEDRSQLISFPVTDGGTAWESASVDFRHAAAVAAFGMLLRDSPYAGEASWNMVENLAALGAARDPHGYRAAFRTLVARAHTMSMD
jgi:Ca-activated chloride channel family protein